MCSVDFCCGFDGEDFGSIKYQYIYAFLTGFLPFVVIVLDDGGSLGGSYVGKLDIEITVSV